MIYDYQIPSDNYYRYNFEQEKSKLITQLKNFKFNFTLCFFLNLNTNKCIINFKIITLKLYIECSLQVIALIKS